MPPQTINVRNSYGFFHMWNFKFTKALHASGRLGYVTLLVFGMVSASCRGGSRWVQVRGGWSQNQGQWKESNMRFGRRSLQSLKNYRKIPKIAIVDRRYIFQTIVFGCFWYLCLSSGGVIPCGVFKVQLTHSLTRSNRQVQRAWDAPAWRSPKRGEAQQTNGFDGLIEVHPHKYDYICMSRFQAVLALWFNEFRAPKQNWS